MITLIFCSVVSPKNIVSSTYCKMLTGMLSFPTANAVNSFLWIASLMSPVRPSATMLNNKGASGSPCLRPLCGENCGVGLPFTKMDTEADLRQPWIHWIHLLLKPNLKACNLMLKAQFENLMVGNPLAHYNVELDSLSSVFRLHIISLLDLVFFFFLIT